MNSRNKVLTNLRAIRGLIFLLVVCLVLIMATAQIHSELYKKNRLLDIQSAKRAIIAQFLNQPEPTILFMYEIPMEIGIIIEPAFDSNIKQKIVCSEKSWLFVADLHPGTTFKHAIKIGIINKTNINKPETIDAEWWPIKTFKGKSEPLYLSSNKWKPFAQSSGKSTIANSRCIYDSLRTVNNIPVDKEIIGIPHASIVWAIIISGHSEKGEEMTFSYDASDMYSTLAHYGVPENQIFYITPIKLQNENDSKVFCHNVSIYTVKTCFEIIKEKIPQEGKLLFFISTHGGVGELILENNQHEEKLTSKLLNDLLNKIKCKNKFIVINSCKSGSFITSLVPPPSKDNSRIVDNNRLVIASCKSGELSCADIDKTLCEPNTGDRGSEFLSGFIESFYIKRKSEIGKISFQEAFDYAKKCALCADNESTTRCGYSAQYHPQIGYSVGIDPNTEFLFWD